MTQKQQNRLSMNKAVLALLDSNFAVWNNFLVFSNARNELNTSVNGRNEAATTQSVTSTGITQDKSSIADTAINLVLALARNASVYALETYNNTLYAQLDFGRHYLTNLPDNEQAATLRGMLGKLEENAANLTGYMVTAAGIAAAQAAVDAVEDMLAKPRTAIDAHSVATQSIATYEAQARHALAKLDKLVYNYTETNSAFVSNYRQARIVVDSGIRHDDKDADDGATPA